jgi:hypothetical protein
MIRKKVMSQKDPLLESIDATLRQQKAQGRATAKAKSESRLERMHEDANAFHRFVAQFTIASIWFWQYILRPIWPAFSWIFRSLFRQYRKVWSLVVYHRDEFGNLRLGKARAGLFLAGSLVSLFFLYSIVGFVYDSAMYGLTSRTNELMYLTSSQEIDATGNVHAVKGCDKLPCSDADSVYFRITPSAFNHVWSLIHNHMVFFPDYVSAAVPPGLNRCTITSYGIRIKLLMRGMDIYPELLKASCTPVTSLSPGEDISHHDVRSPPVSRPN